MTNDLTKGSVGRVLLKFTLPLFISVVFQQMYSIADSVIAGRFAGEDALAAVGASYPITNIFNAVAIGCNIGCSVVISQYFGGKQYTKVKTAASTALISGGVLSAVLAALGIAFTPALMNAVETPADDEVVDETSNDEIIETKSIETESQKQFDFESKIAQLSKSFDERLAEKEEKIKSLESKVEKMTQLFADSLDTIDRMTVAIKNTPVNSGLQYKRPLKK